MRRSGVLLAARGPGERRLLRDSHVAAAAFSRCGAPRERGCRKWGRKPRAPPGGTMTGLASSLGVRLTDVTAQTHLCLPPRHLVRRRNREAARAALCRTQSAASLCDAAQLHPSGLGEFSGLGRVAPTIAFLPAR